MKKISILAVLFTITGCQQYLTRSDFIEKSSGNALRAGTTMQNVDPWQRYVYDTDLETSAARQEEARNRYANGNPPAPVNQQPIMLQPAPPPAASNTTAPN